MKSSRQFALAVVSLSLCGYAAELYQKGGAPLDLVSAGMAFGSFALWLYLALSSHYFPRGDSLKPDARGIIHHPWYGDYPARIEVRVKGREGGSLDLPAVKPGQSAVVEVEVSRERPDEPRRNGGPWMN
jgi:hypothetical protein